MAYQPVKYTGKNDLMNNAVIKRIFANATFEVSADDEQQAMLDMIESLWDRGGVINITYNDLKTLIDNSNLSVGAFYMFEYQTIHKIPYTTELHYGPIEHLVALAIATDKLDETVMSIEHPEDTIWWRYDDNFVLQLVEAPLSGTVDFQGIYPFNYDSLEFSQQFLLLGQPVPRPGRIYKRQDNRRNLLAGEDFRAVVKRRWSLLQPLTLFNSTTPWVSGNTYTVGDIVTSAGVYYEVRISHTATIDVTLANENFYFNLTQLFRGINSVSVDNFAIPTAVVDFVSPTPTSFQCGKYQFGVDNASYIDVTMFDNDGAVLTPDTPDETFCFNITVLPVVGAYIEAPDWEFYSNIVFDKYCCNITVKEMSVNTTVFRTANCEIGKYCSNLLVRGIDYQIATLRIGDFNKNSYFRLENIDIVSPTVTIENGNNKCVFIASNYRIGDGNTLCNIFKASAGHLMNNNFYGFIGQTSGPVFRNKIGSDNSYSIIISGDDNTIGNENTLTYLTGDSHSIGNSTTAVRQLSQPGVSVEGQNYNASRNSVGNYCEYIDIVGSDNIYKERVNYIQASNTVQYSGCTFETGMKRMLFTKLTAGSFSNAKFSGNTVWGSKTVSLDTNTGMSNLHYNIMLSSGLDIGAHYVSSYTNPTTFTTEVIKLL
jgi:hypothetical protein